MASAVPKGQPLNIILLGRTGHGKRSTGNTILQDFTAFEPSFGSFPQGAEMKFSNESGRHIYVVNTQGMCDTYKTQESTRKLRKTLDFFPAGVHAFVLVLRFGIRITVEERDAINLIEKAFGPRLMEYCIVVFTHGDTFRAEMRRKGTPDVDFKNYILSKESEYLRDLIRRCDHRCLIINNVAEDLEPEAAKLVWEIDNMIAGKGGQPFIPKFVGDEACFLS